MKTNFQTILNIMGDSAEDKSMLATLPRKRKVKPASHVHGPVHEYSQDEIKQYCQERGLPYEN